MKQVITTIIVCYTVIGFAQAPFITEWKTTNPGKTCNSCVEIPTNILGNTYNYDIDWENDGIWDEFGITGDALHDYETPGTYQVAIRGRFPQLNFYNIGNGGVEIPKDNNKIIDVINWGDNEWSSMTHSFYDCDSIVEFSASTPPNLSNTNSTSYMFAQTYAFNSDIGDWDMSNIQSINGMFSSAESFNQEIGEWDVSNVTQMGFTFFDAKSFNQDIGDWDIKSTNNLHAMFWRALAFNQDLSSWDVSQIVDMSHMFRHATSFNQDIGNWDVSNVKHMQSMFSGASEFNFDIGEWDVSSVTDGNYLFNYALAFNQDIGGWDVSNFTEMRQMFRHAESFNQDIGDWDVTNVVAMDEMLKNASSFNQDLGNWDLSSAGSASLWSLYSLLDYTNLSIENYEKTLSGWAQNPLTHTKLFVGAETLKYCDETARNYLINELEWTITGDSKPTDKFCASECVNVDIQVELESNESCENLLASAIEASVTGGQPPYLYHWKLGCDIDSVTTEKILLVDQQKIRGGYLIVEDNIGCFSEITLHSPTLTIPQGITTLNVPSISSESSILYELTQHFDLSCNPLEVSTEIDSIVTPSQFDSESSVTVSESSCDTELITTQEQELPILECDELTLYFYEGEIGIDGIDPIELIDSYTIDCNTPSVIQTNIVAYLDNELIGYCNTTLSILSNEETNCIDDGDCSNGIELWDEASCSCITDTELEPLGCTNPQACNYDPTAVCDDGTCNLLTVGGPCDDGNPLTINDTYQTDCTCIGELIECVIEYTYTTTCDPLDTPFDGSDDTYLVYLLPSGVGAVSWSTDIGINGTGPVLTTLGPFLISDGSQTFTLYSELNPVDCKVAVIIAPPEPCNLSCVDIIELTPDEGLVSYQEPFAINVISNDNLHEGSTFTLVSNVSNPALQNLEIDSNGILSGVVQKSFIEDIILEYQVCFQECDTCAVSTVTLKNNDLIDYTFTDVISPNKDGQNDVLKFNEEVEILNSSLFIFNRWGNTIYKSENYTNDWDAEGYPGGIYYYVLELNGATLKKTLTVLK